jgi:hypothetical protein
MRAIGRRTALKAMGTGGGIHQELRYKGNQVLAEFVGCHTVDGKDCPHCGQKARS